MRDAIIDELGDVAQAMLALDQSFTVLHPLIAEVHGTEQGASNSGFVEAAIFQDCNRNQSFNGQSGNPLLDFDAPS